MKKVFFLIAIIFLIGLGTAFAETLILPDSLTVIGAKAFMGDTSLDEVVLPEGIREIKADAFAGSSLSSINLPASLESIADGALPAPGTVTVTAEEGTWAYSWATEYGYFDGNSILYSGSCGNNITWTLYTNGTMCLSGRGEMYRYSDRYRIPWRDYREYITHIEIEEGISYICNYAFYYCVNLETVCIPDSLTTIGTEGFKDCVKLSSVVFPRGMQSIGESAFSGCLNLSEIIIPCPTGRWAFDGCIGLRKAVILEGLSYVSEGEFSGCEVLTEVKLPLGIEEIRKTAFSGCTHLQQIDIPPTVTSFGWGAFAGSGITSFVIPNGVSGIDDWMFNGCDKLEYIEIPTSVTKIGERCFCECDSLQKVYYHGTPAQWKEIEILDTWDGHYPGWNGYHSSYQSYNQPIYNALIIYISNPDSEEAYYSGWGKSAGSVRPVDYAILCKFCTDVSNEETPEKMGDKMYDLLQNGEINGEHPFPIEHPIHSLSREQILAFQLGNPIKDLDGIIIVVDSDNAIVVFAGTKEGQMGDYLQDAGIFLDGLPGIQFLVAPANTTFELFSDDQIESANSLLSQLASFGHNIYVTGYSLGGHIAVDVTLNHSEILECITFDPPGRGDAIISGSNGNAGKIINYCNKYSSISWVGDHIGKVYMLDVYPNDIAGIFHNHDIVYMVDALM